METLKAVGVVLIILAFAFGILSLTKIGWGNLFSWMSKILGLLGAIVYIYGQFAG